MKQAYFKSLSTDELWFLHEKITAKLARKLAAEKKNAYERLRLLKKSPVEQAVRPLSADRTRPFFRNSKYPDEPSETWAGRGKQPRWLRKQLGSGERIDDFKSPHPWRRKRPERPPTNASRR